MLTPAPSARKDKVSHGTNEMIYPLVMLFRVLGILLRFAMQAVMLQSQAIVQWVDGRGGLAAAAQIETQEFRMKNFSSAAVLFLVLLSGCADGSVDKDGVPKVDIHGTIIASTDEKALAFAKEWGLPAPGARMISVHGKQMPLQVFLLTYCQGKVGNDTCERGLKIARIDSSGGPRKELPEGL
ncbi:hypothetical protein [Sterolibacterium denitrificans]|uniref:hypothetical protein n=1 Tax=Sterolibacterium denitrificans TaxID=157592 RepID=UPI001E43BD43|nr:hypothetical protein [Sterolibacterium denitrificans]